MANENKISAAFTKRLNLPSSRLVSFSALYLVDDAPPCKRDIFITRMRSNPRQKLGRISFFSFFMVVANCNASCYWLHVHCSQQQLLLFLLTRFKLVLSSWKALCDKLLDCCTRYTNPQLIAKCEQILCETNFE